MGLLDSHSSPYTSKAANYKGRPCNGIKDLLVRIRRFLRKLYAYFKQHPFKVFMLVIMPLITGGTLHRILLKLGIRLPSPIEEFMGAERSGNSNSENSGNPDWNVTVRGIDYKVGGALKGLIQLMQMLM